MPGKQNSSKKRANPVPRYKEKLAGAANPGSGFRLLVTYPESLFVLLLLSATFAIYSPVREHAFVNYDDVYYVGQNAHIQAGLNWQSVRWALTTGTQGNWHPLTWISHMIDWRLFGPDPAGHHLMSLWLHILSVGLLAWLLTSVTGAPRRSIVVAALFALHPINVESVAWVAERKNVLSTLFFLLTLAAYGRYTRKPSVARYLGVVTVFVLALASKPMVVTLPFVLLLLDYWPLQRVQGWITSGRAYAVPQISFIRCALEKVPLLALSAASSVITLIMQRAGGAVKALDVYSISIRLQNAVYAYVMYLWKALFPARLAVFYPHPGSNLDSWQVGFSIIFVVATMWGAWAARHRAPYLIVGWLWFLGTLVPVIGVVQVGAQAMADRYAYIPLIGIFVAVVWGISDLCEACQINAQWPAAVAVVSIAALSWTTWGQVASWKDSYTLWSHALEVTPDNGLSEEQLGMALIALNRRDDALQHFQKSIALGTRDPAPHLNVGAYMSRHGRLREALPELETALSLSRDTESQVSAQLNLGFVYTLTGDFQNARLHYRAAWLLDHEQVAATIRDLGQFAAAHPSARDYMKLGLLLEQSDRPSEAAAAFERVLQLDPRVEPARAALAELQSSGR